MKYEIPVTIASLLLLATTAAPSAEYTLDTVHTQIRFGVSHMGFSTSRGSFNDFEGKFSFDPDAPETASVNVVIQAASLDMDDAEWNSHLQGEQWFNVGDHPTLSFRSSGIQSSGDDKFVLNGELTMLGVSKPVALDVKLNKVGEAMGKQKAGFSATGTLNRADWGMTTYAPMIGTEISLTIEVEGEQVAE